MNAAEVVHSLVGMGYALTVVNGEVKGERADFFPPPPESEALIDQLRQHKGEVIDILLYRGFVAIPAADGESYTVTAADGATIKRYGIAYRAGLIHLTDRVRAERSTGACTIRFRCAMPLDWLQDAITAACKREYNKVLERIHRGTAWLEGHEDSPEYETHYARYLGLYEELRVLALAVGDVPDDPFTGYPAPRG